MENFEHSISNNRQLDQMDWICLRWTCGFVKNENCASTVLGSLSVRNALCQCVCIEKNNLFFFCIWAVCNQLLFCLQKFSSYTFTITNRLHSLRLSRRLVPSTGAVYIVFFLSVVIFIALLFWWMLSGGLQYVMTPIWINVVFCHCTIVNASLLSLYVACRIVFEFVCCVSHSLTTDSL